MRVGTAVIESAWKMDEAPYRYVTEACFPDMETFEKSFFDPDYPAWLGKVPERIAAPVLVISQEVICESRD